MKKHIIKTEKDTAKLAKKLAGQFKSGQVIGLIGDLGAGKTTFTQYFAKALGIKNTVNSPTFNIIKIYPTLSLRGVQNGSGERRGNPVSNKKKNIKQLIHIDAYRLNSAEELEALGVQEYFDDPQAIAIIEWADKVKKLLPKNAMIIKIKLKKDGIRTFEIK